LKLPELTPGGASADVSYLELIRIVRTIRKIGELASDKGLVAEHPYLVGDLAQTLAQYPSITRAVLQRGMKEVALDNAARIRDSVDASPERLLGKAQRIAATVEALKEHIQGWNVDPALSAMFAFHLKSLSQG
jgi:hypothetical protein